MRLIGDAKTRITLENKQDEYNNATEAGRRELITHYVVGLDFSDFEAVGAINEPPKTIN